MTAQTPAKTTIDALLQLWLRCIVSPEPTQLVALQEAMLPGHWPALSTLAQTHGVLPLLYQLPEIERFCAKNVVDCQTIRAASARTALLGRLHDELLHELDVQLQACNIPALVYKGAALCRTHYPSPGLRPRVDTDLFIEAKNRGRWDQLMCKLGFSSVPSNFSSLVLPERTYQKQLAGAFLQFDVHWSLSSRPALGKLLNFSNLYGAGIAFEHAKVLRMPRAVDALFVAVVHRLGHHRDQERYIWLFDIYLLWSAMDEQMQEYALQLARTLGLSAILKEALETTSTLFGLSVPANTDPGREAAAELLDRSQSPIWFDFKYGNWRERWQLLQERVWAESSYLRHRFSSPTAPIWFLQLRRWFS